VRCVLDAHKQFPADATAGSKSWFGIAESSVRANPRHSSRQTSGIDRALFLNHLNSESPPRTAASE